MSRDHTVKQHPGVSVVVPVFNAETVLPELVSRLEQVLVFGTREFEIVLVNDGSNDHSWAVICELASANAWVRGIDLARNYGQHNAVLAGIRAARHEVVVTIDDDLQHPPEEITRLLSKLAEGYDVVYGTPRRKHHGTWRRAASGLTRLLLQGSMGVDVARQQSSFRAFRTFVRDSFAHYQSPTVFVDALLTWGTTRFAAISVRHDERPIGRSNYTTVALILHAINMTSAFSTLPLRLASLLGFAFTLFGGGVLAYVVIDYLVSGTSVPGFAFLASLIAIFSGAQMLALGIIGEYLARVHMRSIERPPYNVRTRVGHTPTELND